MAVTGVHAPKGVGMTADATFSRGRDFIYREGRLLDQRLFETVFEAAPPQGVLDALRGYRNAA